MGRYSSFDGLRGVFALSVALFHLAFASHLYGLPLIRSAYLAVDFFFVLSGFVIAYAYTSRINSADDARTFMIRRLGRIWPLHIATLAFLVALQLVKLFLTLRAPGLAEANAPFTGQNAPFAILTNFFLFQSLDVHDTNTWNFASWSISAEAVAYVLFAIVCTWLSRWRLLAAGAIVVVSFAIIIAFSTTGMDLTFHLGAVRGCLGFFLGWLTYAASRRLANSWQPGAAQSNAIEAAIAIVVLGFFWVVGRSNLGFAAPFLFAIALLLLSRTKGFLTAVLETRPIQFLGTISYSVYMTHAVVLMLIGMGWHFLEVRLHTSLTVAGASLYGPVAGDAQLMQWHGATVMDGLTLVYLAVVVGVSVVTYRYIETPGREFFGRLADKRAAATGRAVRAPA